MTYVVDVMRTAYGISMHTADGHILCFGAHPQGALTHSSCLKDSSITPADEGAHPVNWTEAKSFLIVSDSLVAVVAEHPELHTPILLTGFARVLAAKTSDKDNWRPISETALPNYLDIYKDRVFDSDNESLLYENGDAGYFRGIRCIRSPDGHGQYIKDGTINNFNFIGRFEATGTCAARNELANTSQMYLCGYRRNLGDAGSPQIVVDRWWMTITGTSPVWRGLLPRSACTYDYNADEIDLEHPTYQDGYNKGYQDGLAAGGGGGEDPGGDYDEGYQTGYQEGYQAGYAAGGLLVPGVGAETELGIGGQLLPQALKGLHPLQPGLDGLPQGDRSVVRGRALQFLRQPQRGGAVLLKLTGGKSRVEAV